MKRTRTFPRALALAAALALSVAAGPARAADVQKNYDKKCRKCHGSSGAGDGPAAAALDVHPGDFTDCARMKSHSHQFLVDIIAKGGGAVGKSDQMPAHAKKLSPEEIDELATYVATRFCGE